ncbi:MAG TPA: hypothetical protein VK166_10485 [Chitinophagaceae bacterium]|nr:hypothetical protein [Chitinophagaceae bacterium]
MKDSKDKEGRSVEILGRSGIKFIDQKKIYFLDSEMLKNPDYEMVVFWGSVRYFHDTPGSTLISEIEKINIAETVIALLAKDGIRADIMK